MVRWKWRPIRVDPQTYERLTYRKTAMEQDLKFLTRNPKARITMPKLIAYVSVYGWDANYDAMKKLMGKWRWQKLER